MGEGTKGKSVKQPPHSSLQPCDRAAVAYRSEDPLENLKIRVQLKNLSGPTKVSERQPEPQPEPEAEDQLPEGEQEAEEGEDGEEDEDAEPEPVRWLSATV